MIIKKIRIKKIFYCNVERVSHTVSEQENVIFLLLTLVTVTKKKYYLLLVRRDTTSSLRIVVHEKANVRL